MSDDWITTYILIGLAWPVYLVIACLYAWSAWRNRVIALRIAGSATRAVRLWKERALAAGWDDIDGDDA